MTGELYPRSGGSAPECLQEALPPAIQKYNHISHLYPESLPSTFRFTHIENYLLNEAESP
jgi:hypothetical protein